MVATDGHRLAHIERTGETLEGISGEKKTLIPRKALGELSSLLSERRMRRRSSLRMTTRRCSFAWAGGC